MPARLLTDKICRELKHPADRAAMIIAWDSEVRGFGLRVTRAGGKSFIVAYRSAGIQRTLTIGSFPDWTVKLAREQAKELKRRVDNGEDPMADRHAERRAKTIADLAAFYRDTHLQKKRPGSRQNDELILRKHVLPRLGSRKIEAVTHSEIAALHRDISKRTPTAANRTVALLSKMFAIAIKEQWIAVNPAKGIERNQENRRERFLTPAEIAKLTEALNAHLNQKSANIVRLLLLTGARRGEVLGATWQQFDLSAGIWVKPAATTKQKRLHRIPLAEPTVQLLRKMKTTAEGEALFPGRAGKPAQAGLKGFWRSICETAGISGVRVHDLRHTYASVLASAGLSLPIIGRLLGHTQSQTTARYAHLLDDPLRAATERAGSIISGGSAGKSADIVPLPVGRAR